MFQKSIQAALLAGAFFFASGASAGIAGKQMIKSPYDQVEAAIQGVRAPGQPVIVLIHGLGSGMGTWKKLLPLLSAQHQVFAYNRPGYGNSGWSGRKRDAFNIAEELRATLDSAGLAPPYLIVGHSMGGVYAQAFASRYPEETSAMLLIDTAVPHQRAMLEKKGFLQSAFIGNVMLDGSPMPRREYFNQNENDAEMDAAPLYAKGKVTMLMADHLDPISPGGYVRARQDAMRVLADRYQAKLVPVDSGHFIHKQRPETVVGAINEMLAASGVH
jgi:pimeloyl-ACP methyl ester carboxylesterase